MYGEKFDSNNNAFNNTSSTLYSQNGGNNYQYQQNNYQYQQSNFQQQPSVFGNTNKSQYQPQNNAFKQPGPHNSMNMNNSGSMQINSQQNKNTYAAFGQAKHPEIKVQPEGGCCCCCQII
jgi:hypothetical protein